MVHDIIFQWQSWPHGKISADKAIAFEKRKESCWKNSGGYVSSPVGVIGNTNLIAVSDKRSVVEN